jgi:hypothetical protein
MGVKPFCHPEGRINIDIVRRLLGPKKDKNNCGTEKNKLHEQLRNFRISQMSLLKDSEMGETYSMYKKVNGRNGLVSDLNLKGIDMLADVGVDGMMSV